MTSPYRLPTLSLAATALALTGLAAGSTGFGVAIESTYAEAFERIEATRPLPADRSSGHATGRTSDGVTDRRAAGLNPAHIHLSRLPVAEAKRPAFAVGDRMTLAAREGGNRTFDVVEVRPLTGELGSGSDGATALSSSPSARLFLVTAVSTDDLRTRTVRFIIDADGPADQLPVQDAPARPHAL